MGLLVVVVCLYCLYRKVQKRLNMSRKDKNSDEDIPRVQEADNNRLVDNMENGNGNGEQQVQNIGVRDLAASDESLTVFDRKEAKVYYLRGNSRKDR